VEGRYLERDYSTGLPTLMNGEVAQNDVLGQPFPLPAGILDDDSGNR
jgi:hypothetical protein